MNKDKIRECLNYRIRLRPLPRRVWQGSEQEQIDDAWHVESVNKKGVVTLSNIRTAHVAKLGADHIHHFDSDPMSETDGYHHGFFILKAQLIFEDGQLRIEPGTLNERYRG